MNTLVMVPVLGSGVFLGLPDTLQLPLQLGMERAEQVESTVCPLGSQPNLLGLTYNKHKFKHLFKITKNPPNPPKPVGDLFLKNP